MYYVCVCVLFYPLHVRAFCNAFKIEAYFDHFLQQNRFLFQFQWLGSGLFIRDDHWNADNHHGQNVIAKKYR